MKPAEFTVENASSSVAVTWPMPLCKSGLLQSYISWETAANLFSPRVPGTLELAFVLNMILVFCKT